MSNISVSLLITDACKPIYMLVLPVVKIANISQDIDLPGIVVCYERDTCLLEHWLRAFVCRGVAFKHCLIRDTSQKLLQAYGSYCCDLHETQRVKSGRKLHADMHSLDLRRSTMGRVSVLVLSRNLQQVKQQQRRLRQ